MEDMGHFGNMVECKGNSANQIGLPDSATGLKKEMTVVTSLETRVGIDFATYYIVEHYTVGAEKKKLGLETYQIVSAATGGAGSSTPILVLLPLPYILLLIQEVRGSSQ